MSETTPEKPDLTTEITPALLREIADGLESGRIGLQRHALMTVFEVNTATCKILSLRYVERKTREIKPTMLKG